MPRTSETPEQRAARTAKARATFLARFSSPEEKAEYYRSIVARRADRQKPGELNVPSDPVPDHAG